MDCTDLREDKSFSFDLNFFHDFGWTRTYIPFPFLPNAKPRNLKFRIANTLTVLLFSRLTVNFSVSSRYFVLLPRSLLIPVYSLPTAQCHLHIGCTRLLSIETPGQTHWGRYSQAMVINSPLAVTLPLCQWPPHFPWLHFSDSVLSSALPAHPLHSSGENW